jgi:hypothetical protein
MSSVLSRKFVAKIPVVEEASRIPLGRKILAQGARRCEKINRVHHRGTETQRKSFLFRLRASVSLWFERR